MKKFYTSLVMVSLLCGCRTTQETHTLHVIDGDKVAPKEFPAAITLVRFDGVRCGGGVIGPNAVVTAAHCLGNLHDGGIAAQFYSENGDLQEVRALHATIHPDLQRHIEKELGSNSKSKSQIDIRSFFNRFAGQVQVGSEHSESGTYDAIAVDQYEYRGPEGEKIAPLDFAVLVFPENTFHTYFPVFTETPPEDVYFVGKGVYTDTLQRVNVDEAIKGQNKLPKNPSSSVFITNSLAQSDNKSGKSNSFAALGDSGIPLWAIVGGKEAGKNVTLAINSSGGYWVNRSNSHRTYYGRFSAIPEGTTDFIRENIWIPLMSETSLLVIKNAINHTKFKANILFYPALPRFPYND